MTTILSLEAALLIGTITTNGVLAFWVYRNNPRSATNILFSMLSVVLSLWLVANYISINPLFLSLSLFWIRTTIFLATPLSAIVFLLALTLPREHIPLNRKVSGAFIALTVFIMAVAVSPYAFTEVLIVDDTPEPSTGPGIIFFGLFAVTTNILTIYILFKRYISATEKTVRRQMLFMILGIGLMFGGTILTVFLPAVLGGKNALVSFIPLYALIFLGMTGYAIVRYNLFNIRIIATELFATLVVFVFLLNALRSESSGAFALNLGLLVLATIFSILLVRGTIREIRALQELSDAKTEFINIASHQLRTPLTALKGYLSLMKEGTYGALQEKQRETVDKLYATNESMIRLVNDLLNVSRADEGRLHYVFKKVDLRELISGVTNRIRVNAQTKGLSLIWDPPKEEVPVIADDDKLSQVVSNLIDNAIKYTEHGTITIRISMEESLGRHVMVRVSDTGIGIPKDELPKLFERFTRGRGGQRVSSSGAGLGLYIAKTIAEGHKGRVWVESEGEGKGSTFIIELPLATSPEAQALVSGVEEK